MGRWGFEGCRSLCVSVVKSKLANMRKLIVLTALVAVIGGGVAAVKFLPWWGLLLAAAGLGLGGKWLVSRAIRRLLTAPFKLKGAVLRGATAQVHSVIPAAAPVPGQNDDETSLSGREHYLLEVSITPAAPAEGPFQLWEPGDLRLVHPDHRLNPDAAEADEDDDHCSIRKVEIEQEGQFLTDDGWKLPGPQRLRLLLAVKPGTPRLKFRYYFENFGEVNLPAAPAAQAA